MILMPRIPRHKVPLHCRLLVPGILCTWDSLNGWNHACDKTKRIPCTGDSLYYGFPDTRFLHCGFPVLGILPRPRFYCVPPRYCVSPRRSVSLYCLFSVPQRVCLPQRVCYATACAAPRLAPSRSLHPSFISSPHHALGEFIEHRLGWRHEHYPTYSFFCGFRSFSQRDAAGVRPVDVHPVDVHPTSICPVNIRHDVRH